MDYDYIEKEVLEISSFLQMLVHLDSKELDVLDLQTVASVFASKADNLYCYIADYLTKETLKGRN